MFRTLLTCSLALALVAEASAQTAPKATAPRKATAAQPARNAAGRNNIGPAGNGAVGSTESADGKGQNVYAAPGMPVNVDNPKKVQGYNGPAPVRGRRGTTLTPC